MGAEEASWLQQAFLDMEAAQYNLDGGHFHVVAFLAQQAAEKGLKAVFIARNDRLWRTHDLAALAESLDAPTIVRTAAEALSPHYVATRYPVSDPREYDLEAAADAIEAAGLVLEWAEGQL